MSEHCAKCGEELLGAVNKCWRCGTDVSTKPVTVGLPPTSGLPPATALPPLPLTGEKTELAANFLPGGTTGPAPTKPVEQPSGDEKTPLAHSDPLPPVSPGFAGNASDQSDLVFAEVIDTPSSRPELPTEPPTNDQLAKQQATGGTDEPPAESPPLPPGQSSQPVRRGSPFAAHPRFAPRPMRPAYPRNAAATGGAFAAALLGVMGIAGSFFTPLGGMITALLGISLGIWGLYSDQRGVATLGTALCAVALAIGGTRVVFQAYDFWNQKQADPNAVDYNPPENTKQW